MQMGVQEVGNTTADAQHRNGNINPNINPNALGNTEEEMLEATNQAGSSEESITATKHAQFAESKGIDKTERPSNTERPSLFSLLRLSSPTSLATEDELLFDINIWVLFNPFPFHQSHRSHRSHQYHSSDDVTLPFCHSAILPFCHSAILPFCLIFRVEHF
jgi:hypothetical protein